MEVRGSETCRKGKDQDLYQPEMCADEMFFNNEELDRVLALPHLEREQEFVALVLTKDFRRTHFGREH
jgi:hypothetical protein